MAIAQTQQVHVMQGRRARMAGRWRALRSLHTLMRVRARSGHLQYWRQAAEMLWLKVTRHIGVHYYQTAGMWQSEMPWSEKVGHLGVASYLKALDRANPAPYRKLTQHKLPEKALLTLLGLPTPRYLGFAHPLGGRTAAGAPLTNAREFSAFLAALDADRICLKLMEGQGGNGFVAAQVIRASGGPRLLPFGTAADMAVDEFYTRYVAGARYGRLIEEYIEQHPRCAALNDTSVNTLRILVYARPEAHARAIGAYLRIGRRGSLVDNVGAGGLIAPVDFASGRLGAAFDGTPERRTYATHPDSGAPIEGVELPFWKEAVALAETALTSLPRTRFAGLDVAITAQGPVLIEVNNYPGIDGVASTNLQMARVIDPRDLA